MSLGRILIIMSLKTGVVGAHSVHRMPAYAGNTGGVKRKHRQFAMAEGDGIPKTVMGKASVATAEGPEIRRVVKLCETTGGDAALEIGYKVNFGKITPQEGERQLRSLKQSS